MPFRIGMSQHSCGCRSGAKYRSSWTELLGAEDVLVGYLGASSIMTAVQSLAPVYVQYAIGTPQWAPLQSLGVAVGAIEILRVGSDGLASAGGREISSR